MAIGTSSRSAEQGKSCLEPRRGAGRCAGAAASAGSQESHALAGDGARNARWPRGRQRHRMREKSHPPLRQRQPGAEVGEDEPPEDRIDHLAGDPCAVNAVAITNRMVAESKTSSQ